MIITVDVEVPYNWLVCEKCNSADVWATVQVNPNQRVQAAIISTTNSIITGECEECDCKVLVESEGVPR